MDILRSTLLLNLALLIVGCGAGSGEGLDPNGQPANSSVTTALVPEFSSIQRNVLTPVCTICHAGAAAPLGLRLDEANSYTALVNVSSAQAPASLRVNPGNPDASYLLAKLEGTASVGAQMPLGGPALPQATIDVIRQWILDGAQPASTVAPPASQPPIVTSTNPADASTLTALPPSINVSFSHDMDATSFNNTTVVLQGSGGDGNFTDGNEIIITPTAISLAPATLLTINLSNLSSVDDSYQLILKGSGGAPIQDLNSNALDGNNDGVAGDDYSISFVVQSPNNSQLQPTWRSIQDNVFTPLCIVCHSGGSAPEGLQLDEANSYAMLVNVASQQAPLILRVAPNNADNSYLIQKLEGTASNGSQMPRGGPALSQDTINIIRQWINAGATLDTNPPPPPPPSDSDINLTLTAVPTVTNGDEFMVTSNVQNNGSASVNNLSITLAWSPSTSARLRSGDPTQTIVTLDIGQSTSISWTLRAEEIGSLTLTATAADDNQQPVGSSDVSVTITN